METDDPLVPMFVPALVVLLFRREHDQGRPLTEEEVLMICDEATCVMTRRSTTAEVARERGYPDIDPENAWDEWQAVRRTLDDA